MPRVLPFPRDPEYVGAKCPHCGRFRSCGCAFGCPDKMPPANPADYQAWADEQTREYQRRGIPYRQSS